MSTVKTTNLQNPSAASPNIVLGSSGSVAVAGALTGAGMDLVNATTFSAASSVSLNNVFGSTYAQYRIIVDCIASTNIVALQFKFRLSGVDSSAGYYGAGYSVAFNGTAGINGTKNAGSEASLHQSISNANQAQYIFDASGLRAYPNLPQIIGMSTSSYDGSARFFGYYATAVNSPDGFTVYPSSGTITGTVRVYGYRNA